MPHRFAEFGSGPIQASLFAAAALLQSGTGDRATCKAGGPIRT